MKNTLILFFLFCTTILFAQNKIDRIEPPNWWAGMENSSLQLLVHGDNIGHLRPEISYEGVNIEQVIRVKNPNYIFIDLRLNKDIKAGDISINFYDGARKAETHAYPILARDGKGRKGFDNSDVLYLITPDRFANGDASNDDIEGMREKANRKNKGGRHGGDIQGIIDNLDYIADMGFTAIWLNPVLENDMEEYSYHGYSTTDYYRVDARFGTNEQYQELSKKASEKGIKLIMDMIVNHCGSFHWWMDDTPTDDWINEWSEYTNTNHRKVTIQDPYASKIDVKTFTDGWFVPTMPDLNQRNPLMANYLTQNAIWWIEYLSLAGIRMDTYPYPDMDYMTEWTARVMEEYPDFNVVGEEWFGDPAIVAYWQQGKKNPNGYTSSLKSLMDFPVQEKMVKALTSEEDWGTGVIELYEMLAKDFLYADPSVLVTFPDNHDMSRIFTQVNEDYDLFRQAMVFTLTTRGTPQIYYGTEILMKNPGTGDHGIIRSDFPGGWKGDAINGFTGKGLSEQEQEAKEFVRKLLQWRKSKEVIHTGKLMHFAPQMRSGVYVYFRYNDTDKVMVVLNKNEGNTTLSLDQYAEMLEGISSATDVLSGKTYDLKKSIELPSREALILELK